MGDKDISFREFMDVFVSRFEDDRIVAQLIQAVFREIIQEITSNPENPSDWMDRKGDPNEEESREAARWLYQAAGEKLWFEATRIFDRFGDSVFEKSNLILEILRKLIDETHGLKLKPVSIANPIEQLVDAGMVELENRAFGKNREE